MGPGLGTRERQDLPAGAFSVKQYDAVLKIKNGGDRKYRKGSLLWGSVPRELRLITEDDALITVYWDGQAIGPFRATPAKHKSGHVYLPGCTVPETWPCSNSNDFKLPVKISFTSVIPLNQPVVTIEVEPEITLDEQRLFKSVDITRKLEEQGGLCALCRKPCVRAAAHGDHRFPHSQGGLTIYENLMVVHRSCHKLKGTRNIEDVIWDFANKAIEEIIRANA